MSLLWPLMDSDGCQRKLEIIPASLLHGPSEALVANLNEKTALNWILPLQPLPSHGYRHSLQFQSN